MLHFNGTPLLAEVQYDWSQANDGRRRPLGLSVCPRTLTTKSWTIKLRFSFLFLSVYNFEKGLWSCLMKYCGCCKTDCTVSLTEWGDSKDTSWFWLQFIFIIDSFSNYLFLLIANSMQSSSLLTCFGDVLQSAESFFLWPWKLNSRPPHSLFSQLSTLPLYSYQ